MRYVLEHAVPQRAELEQQRHARRLDDGGRLRLEPSRKRLELLHRGERAGDRLQMRQQESEHAPDPLGFLQLLAHLLGERRVLGAARFAPLVRSFVGALVHAAQRVEVLLELLPRFGERLLQLPVLHGARRRLDMLHRVAQRVGK